MQSVVTGQAPTTYILPLPINVDGILWGSSWTTLTLAVRRSDILPVLAFVFLERKWLYHRPSGIWLFGCSDGEYMNNSTPWEAHTSCWAVGLMPKTTCTSITSRSTKSSVPLSVNHFWGAYPFLSSGFFCRIFNQIDHWNHLYLSFFPPRDIS